MLQFHLMLSNYNKQIVNFMEGYPNLNFLFTWAALLFLSYGTFKCTVVLRFILLFIFVLFFVFCFFLPVSNIEIPALHQISEFFFPYSLNPQKTFYRCVIISLFSFAFLFLSYLWYLIEGVFGLSLVELWCVWCVFLVIGGRAVMFLPVQTVAGLQKAWNVESKK